MHFSDAIMLFRLTQFEEGLEGPFPQVGRNLVQAEVGNSCTALGYLRWTYFEDDGAGYL